MTEVEEKRMATLEEQVISLLEFCQKLEARLAATDVIAEGFIHGTLATMPAIQAPFSEVLASLADEMEPQIPEIQRGIFSQKVDAMAEKIWDF